MDAIELSGIRALGRHGANEGERDNEQTFLIDILLEADLRLSAASDSLDDTIDYAALHADIVHTVAATSFALLERLAAALVEVCLADSRVVRAQVRVAKPELLAGSTPSVTLRRDNPRYRPA